MFDHLQRRDILQKRLLRVHEYAQLERLYDWLGSYTVHWYLQAHNSSIAGKENPEELGVTRTDSDKAVDRAAAIGFAAYINHIKLEMELAENEMRDWQLLATDLS